jgi:hypothetical protein
MKTCDLATHTAWSAILTLVFGESEAGLLRAFELEEIDADDARAKVASAREVAERLTALCDAATRVVDEYATTGAR